jgi:hypothetical protein
MMPTVPRRCPHRGGYLYLDPDLIERRAELVCLQCMRRFLFVRRPGGFPNDEPRRGCVAAPVRAGEVGPTR